MARMANSWGLGWLHIAFLALISLRHVAADNITNPVSIFRSRPDLYPAILHLSHHEPEELAPGYFFLTPYQHDNPGPYIYDNNGDLVWTGWGNSGPANVHGLHVCQYKGKDHLCMFQGNQQLGYCRGHGIIMDNQYRIVRSVQPGNGIASSDMHEFRLHNDGETAVLTIYQQVHWDMSAWNIKIGSAYLMDSIFQEINTTSGEVLFEWRASDHVELDASDTLPDTTDTSGSGLSAHHPWDFFHINSIDKNADGDYLISSRHTSCIYKINGKDGSIMWRLNGHRPSFKNTNFGFSKQHDARWLSENKTHTVVSFYNNGFNGYNRTQPNSSGMIVAIDHEAKTATMLHEYPAPDRGMSSSSQGSTHVQKNKNVVQGWGNNCFLSEHNEEGKLLLWGYIALSNTMNYRVLKYEWDAEPMDTPALWTYSKHGSEFGKTAFYVSWNGATRVKTWRFWGSDAKNGTYTPIANVTKRGFETMYEHEGYFPWVKAEALDVNGTAIRNSTAHHTFVPGPEIRPFCEDHACQLGDVSQFGIPAGMATPELHEPEPLVPPEPEPVPEPVAKPQPNEPVAGQEPPPDSQAADPPATDDATDNGSGDVPQGTWDKGNDETAADHSTEPESDAASNDDTNTGLSDTDAKPAEDKPKDKPEDKKPAGRTGPTPTWMWILRVFLVGGVVWGLVLLSRYGIAYVNRRYGMDISPSRFNPFRRNGAGYTREGNWGDDDEVGMGLMQGDHNENGDGGNGLGVGKNSYVSRLRGGSGGAVGGKRVFSFERWLHRRNPSNAEGGGQGHYAPVSDGMTQVER